MAFVYLWVALIAILLLMLFIKLIASIVCAGKGVTAVWSGYNAILWGLAALVFFPIMVLGALLKRTK